MDVSSKGFAVNDRVVFKMDAEILCVFLQQRRLCGKFIVPLMAQKYMREKASNFARHALSA